MTDQLFSVHGNVSTPTRHRQFDQTNGKQCTCCIQSTNESSNPEDQATAIGKRGPHTEYEGSAANEDKNVRDKKRVAEMGSRSAK